MKEAFRKFAHVTSEIVGSAWMFIGALVLIVVWGATGPMFDYSDTWQLVINTSTTIVTFLMVFLIQNTQNRDAKVIHLKLDELLRAIKSARTSFAQLETLSDEELDRVQREFLDLCQRERTKRGGLHPIEEQMLDKQREKVVEGAKMRDQGSPTDKL